MTAIDFIALLPIIVVAATSIAVMIGVAVRRSHAASALTTMVGLAAAFLSLLPAAAAAPRQVTPLLIIDSYALFFMGLLIASSFVVAALMWPYLARQTGEQDEMYILLLVAALGAVVLAAASHFAAFFLGLELLSVPLYAMVAYRHTRREAVEAGLKYLILAGAASAFLLFGIALVYARLGTLSFDRMAQTLVGFTAGEFGILGPALALIAVGAGFKLAVAPFHMWTPDVYQGAPAPVTGFIATVSKGAVFAVVMRFLYATGASGFEAASVVVSVLAIASMVAGNLLALLQTNLKRLLAYSSIAHLGYALVALQAGGEMGATAAAFYLTAYFVTILGAFGIVGALSGEDEPERIADYRGMFWRRPLAAGVLTVMLLSLGGIPLTAGFLAKFYAVAAGASATLWALILVLVITSGIGIFYYLRVVVAIYATDTMAPPLPAISTGSGVVLGVLTAALLFLGTFPGPMLDLIRATVRLRG